jgi:hypothetical protein
MGVDYMNRNEMHFFFETSALTGENVEMVIKYLRINILNICEEIQI